MCLVPNSIGKLQPLDVGIFRSMKSHWRAVQDRPSKKSRKLMEEKREEEYDNDSDEGDVQPQRKKGRQILLSDKDERPADKGPDYPVGPFVDAVFIKIWYIVQVEGEESDNECKGFSLLKYLDKGGQPVCEGMIH